MHITAQSPSSEARQPLPSSALPPRPGRCAESFQCPQPLQVTARLREETSSHQTRVSEPHVHLYTAAFPIPFSPPTPSSSSLRAADGRRAAGPRTPRRLPANQEEVRENAHVHRAWERGARVPELLSPVATILTNLALRFRRLRSLSEGFPFLGRQEPFGGAPASPWLVWDGAANGEPPAPP